MDPVIGGALVGGGLNVLGGLFGPGIKKQTKYQKQLNEHAAQLNYQYGEQAAENAYERQIGMYERTLEDNSPAEQVKRLEKAGLSVGLMYGSSGTTGQGQATTAPMGSGSGGQQGGNAAAMYGAKSAAAQAIAQSMSVGLQIARQKAEIKNIEAQTEKTQAEAKTETDKRETFIENIKQEGQQKWLKNIQTQWEMEGEKEGMSIYKNKQYGDTAIIPNGYYGQQIAADIATAWGNANNIEALSKLNANKAEGYFQELLNATSEADSKAIEAAAKKLETEWRTGTGMNWGSWASIAKDIITTLIRK